MKIGVTGASGFLGEAILAEAKKRKWTVVAFSRNSDSPIPNSDEVRSLADPSQADLSGLDTLIHLAGEPVAGRWSKEKKKHIRDSRIDITNALVTRLEELPENERPKTFISASGVGIYGNSGGDLQDEDSDIGFGFLANLCRHWEAASMKAADLGIRTVCPRIGIILGRNGGIVKAIEKPFRLGLGGRLGSGDQWMSWIHIEDAARVFVFCVEHSAIQGPVNCVAPHPVTNAAFTHSFAASMNRKARLPVPAFILKNLPHGMGEMFLFGQRVDPVVIRAFDFKWKHEHLGEALRSILEEPEPDIEPEDKA